MLSFITVNKMENNLKKVINNMCAGRAVLKKGSGSGSGRIAAEVLPAMNDSKKKNLWCVHYNNLFRPYTNDQNIALIPRLSRTDFITKLFNCMIKILPFKN